METGSDRSVLERVRQIIASTTGTEDAAISAKVVDLCDDSLEAASVIVDLEDEFSIDIEGFHEYATVGDLVKFIEAKP